MANRVAVETIRTLHTLFGDEAVMEQVLLCGNFARTVGLAEHMNTMLQGECVLAGKDTLPGHAAFTQVEDELEMIFPVAMVGARGADLMAQYKAEQSAKQQSVALCVGLGVVLVGLMVATPMLKRGVESARDAAAARLQQPEYVAVKALYDEADALGRKKDALAAAIEALPHGASNMAGIVSDVKTLTEAYGTLADLAVDYNASTISINFTTLNYDSFVLWQKAVTESGRFTFMKPPTFEGNGMIYTAEAVLTATDFEDATLTGDAETGEEEFDEKDANDIAKQEGLIP